MQDEPGPQNEQKKLTVPAEQAGESLLQFLSRRLIGESKTALRGMIGDGSIRLNGRAAPTGRRVREGDVVSLPSGVCPESPPDRRMALDVLHEDADHLCINKPPGVPVLPARDGGGAEFYESLVARLNREAPPGGPYRRPHVVHRLDRQTSGVLLVAKHVEAARSLSRQFQSREVEKSYLCIVEGVFPRRRAELAIPLERKPGSVLQMQPAERGGKPATTLLLRRERFGHFTLLEVRPRTGRQHQIRVHLSACGYPPVVDYHYGRRDSLRGEDLNAILGRRVEPAGKTLLDRLPLHASAIRYRPPSGEAVRTQECPLPSDLEAFLDRLRAADPPGE